jgi:outer membrane protein TolC
MSRSVLFCSATLVASLALLSGCKSLSSQEERVSRQQFKAVSDEREQALPSVALPQENAPLSEYLRFALLKHPAVFSSYSEWKSSIAAINPAKALPDPQLTFQADIQGTLMSFMPGFMFDLMLPGKREAMSRELSAGSLVAAKAYLASASKVAGEVHRTFIQIAYVEQAIELKQASLHNLGQRQQIAAAEYQTGTGMGNLESQLRLASEKEKLESDLQTLNDRLDSARAEFKAALGLQPNDASPSWPHPRLQRAAIPTEGELWALIKANNPDLGKMRAMVDMAIAQEAIAKQGKIPDFTAGLMVDVKQAPWMWRPTATMSLPIWRGKIAGQIETAAARREAAQAAVDAELLNMSAELARMLYMIRESDRMIAFIDSSAIPKIRQTVLSAQASAGTGMGNPSMIPEGQGMEIAMNTERLAALRDRELAVAALALMTAQIPAESGLNQFKK